MDHKIVIEIVKTLASQSPMNWENRVQAMEAAKVVENVVTAYDNLIAEKNQTKPTP